MQKRIGPVWLVGDGCLYRRLHLALCGYREQDEPLDSNCRAAIGNREGKQMVLSVTPKRHGNNVKYLIKLPEADKLQAATKEKSQSEKVSSWEIERLARL
jgi:hypothetical protein